MDFVGKPPSTDHLPKGPVIDFGRNPEAIDIEWRLARVIDAINMIGDRDRDARTAFLLFAAAVANQPSVDRERLIADLLVVIEAHYRTPHSGAVPAFLHTLLWCIRTGYTGSAGAGPDAAPSGRPPQ